VKAAAACVTWEGSASRLNHDENSHGQPNEKYALAVARIMVHYMINGGFLDANGEANRDNNYILDNVARLRESRSMSCKVVTTGCAISTKQKPSCEPCAAPAIAGSIISSQRPDIAASSPKRTPGSGRF
jgi:hypothetical protein